MAVISAGLGYVQSNKPIPVYDLTIRTSTSGSIRRRVRGSFDLTEWWREIVQGPFSTDPIADIIDRPAVYVCISVSYVPLLVPALLAYLERDQEGKLRLFGESLKPVLPQRLHPYIMPYDWRLNAVGYAGVRSDFAHRALLHYSREIALRYDGSLLNESHAIRRSLQKGKSVTQPVNRRATDDQIRQAIRRLYDETDMSRTKMLAHLRHVEKIACEQSRFATLYREIIKTNEDV